MQFWDNKRYDFSLMDAEKSRVNVNRNFRMKRCFLTMNRTSKNSRHHVMIKDSSSRSRGACLFAAMRIGSAALLPISSRTVTDIAGIEPTADVETVKVISAPKNTAATKLLKSSVADAPENEDVMHQMYGDKFEDDLKIDKETLALVEELKKGKAGKALRDIVSKMGESMRDQMVKTAADTVHLRLIREKKFPHFVMYLRTGSYNINDYDHCQRSALDYACKHKTMNCMNAILHINGIDINSVSPNSKRTALHAAVEFGFHDGLRRLLEVPGIDVNAQDSQGRSALYLAVHYNDLESLKSLLEVEGIKVNLETAKGFTALEHAIEKNAVHMLLPLAAKSDLCKVNQAGFTPLQTALHFGETRCIRGLLRAIVAYRKKEIADINADPLNKQDIDGNTPLHYAAAKSPAGLLKLLVKCGSKLDVKNSSGELPIDIARKRATGQSHLKDIFKLLEPHEENKK